MSITLREQNCICITENHSFFVTLLLSIICLNIMHKNIAFICLIFINLYVTLELKCDIHIQVVSYISPCTKFPILNFNLKFLHFPIFFNSILHSLCLAFIISFNVICHFLFLNISLKFWHSLACFILFYFSLSNSLGI